MDVNPRQELEELRRLEFLERKANGETAPNEKHDPKQSTIAYMLNRAQQGAAGLLSLPAEVVYHGGQLMRRGLSNIPGYTDVVPAVPIESPAALAKRTLSDTSMKAPSRGAEVLGGAAEFAGAGALPSASVIGNAAHKIPAIAAEIGSAVGGGVGSELFGLPGALAGSVAGLATPLFSSKLYSFVSGAVPWLKSKAAVQAPAELNAALQANPQSGANIQASDDIAAKLKDMGGGEFKPTLAAQTNAPGIIAREEQIAGSSAEELAKYAARRTENEAVISRAKDTAFPAGGNFQRPAGDIRRGVTTVLETKLDNINSARESLAKKMSASPQQEVGNALDKLRDQAQLVARGVKNSKIQDVYATADRLGIKEDMADVLASVRKVGGSDENIFQNMPPVFGKIVRQYGQKEAEQTGRAIPPDIAAMLSAQSKAKPATFQELHSLWREANTQYGTALRSGDAQSQYYIQQVRDALKAKLDKFEQRGFGELTEKFRDFNRFYATKYAPAFKEGVGGRMDATGRYGDVLKKEDVVSKFFTPSGIDDFNLVYGSDKAAQAALADGVTGMFRQSVVRNGKIDPKAAQAFVRSNAETLDKVPDIKALLSNPAAANEALLESAIRVRQNISSFNKSAVANIAKTNNPDAVIGKALTDKKAMMQLVALAHQGGPRAVKPVLRAVADAIPAAASRARVDPLTFVLQNEAALKPALERLGKGHYENLKTIAGANAILGRTAVPQHIGAQHLGDPIQNITGSSARTVWAQSANAAAGRQSKVSGGLFLLSRYGIMAREESAAKLMSEAIYNPEIAATWAKMARGAAISVPESNSLLNHLYSAGIRIAAGSQEQ